MAVIKDVAALAGVSTGTVSKYLNNPQSLKKETKKRVEEAILQLKYKPSPLAQSMRTGKTNTVAVIVPDIINPFFAELYNHIRLSASLSGYTSILYTTEDNPYILKDCLSVVSMRQLDGIILCFLDEDETVEALIKDMQSQTPIVLLGWDMSNTKFNSVIVDVFEGIFKATQHLIDQGHKNIAYVGGPENDRISVEKYQGYARAMASAGYEIYPSQVFRLSYTLQSGYQAARRLTMQPQLPAALVAENDILAIGSMKFFLQNKIHIPEDISVIGFDNIPLSLMYEPSLSTVSLPVEEMGKEAVQLLLRRINRTVSKNTQVVLKTRLIVRNSTDRNAPHVFE